MQITYYPELNNNVQTLICNLPNYAFSKQSVTIVSGVQTVDDNSLKLLLLTTYFSQLVDGNIIVLDGVLDGDDPIYPDAKPKDTILISGVTDAGTTENVAVADDGTLKTPGGGGGGSADFGTKITDATMPTGGVGNLGWLSAIWKIVSDRLPTLVGGKIPVINPVAPASTLTNVASSATSITLLAENSDRKTVIIANDSTSTLYIAFNASAASTTNYSAVLAPLSLGIPATVILKGEDYSGEIRGIWDSANGFARVTEIV